MKKLIAGAAIAVVLGGAGYFMADKFVDMKVESDVAAYLKERKLDDKVTYQSIDHSLLGSSFTINNLKVKDDSGINYDIDKIVVDKYRVDGEVPVAVDMRVIGARPPAAMLSEMGVKDLSINSRISYTVDREKRAFSLKETSFEAQGYGTMGMSFELKNIDSERFKQYNEASAKEGGMDSQMSAQLFADLAKIEFAGGTLFVEDNGAVDRILEQQAKREGISKEQARAKSLAGLDQEIASAQVPFQRELYTRIRSIIEKGGGKFKITSSPTKPIGFQEGYMMVLTSSRPERLLNTLALKVE